jgi:DNA-binding LacI/PurR family transcriptional regulator
MTTISGRTDDWKGGLAEEEKQILAQRSLIGVTAAVCWGDPSAHALIAYCRSVGISVPQDLAIAGFNGIEPPVEPARVMTTVKAHWSTVAERSVHLLVDLLEGREAPMLTVLPVNFFPGDTT